MQRPVKVKSTQVPLRKSALTSGAAARRSFPAWIEADDRVPAAVTMTAVTKRVRDALVLRTVARKKSAAAKGSPDVSGAR